MRLDSPVFCSVGQRAYGLRRTRTTLSDKTTDPSAFHSTPELPPVSEAEPAPSQAAAPTDEIEALKADRGLRAVFENEGLDPKDVLGRLKYEAELAKLQIELVRLQRTVQLQGRRVCVLFEGRDAAGKGGAIRRFMEHLNPRTARVVALPKPTEVERGQWYFQRYVAALPNPGEICFFDRSWYNRAVVEPVMGFCSQQQYNLFMQQVPEFEHMLYEDGIELIKFWFSVSKEEQARRFDERRKNPLKQWKLSPVDDRAQDRWDLYTRYKEEMFSRAHTSFSPWIIVRANSKKKARLESMRYLLSVLPYEGKEKPCINIRPDPAVILRFHRSARQIDT
ncbi:MAG: polyphosphate kinase 2 [Polyangiaceae bacterium]|nr:polyphosphate kinase 2 [Polyangiaceae bacterium]